MLLAAKPLPWALKSAETFAVFIRSKPLMSCLSDFARLLTSSASKVTRPSKIGGSDSVARPVNPASKFDPLSIMSAFLAVRILPS